MTTAPYKDGVQVTFRNAKGERVRQRLRVFDFEIPENNHFLCVRELWARADLYRRRADIVGFVNGLPLLFMELKNVSRDIRAAYEQNFLDYGDTVPHLFHHNAFVVLANGLDAKLGSLTSRFEHFSEWKRLAENQPGVVAMETLLKEVCAKANFLDLVENFIVFDDSAGESRKILARNHQFLGVNFTFLILTDRDDLDTQIYKTFAGCGVVDNDRDPCRAASGEHLAELLSQHKSHVFTLIQKFKSLNATPSPGLRPLSPTGRGAGGEGQQSQILTLSNRDDIIAIVDEAHRTQYGTLALNMRNALPNASFIGFTGTWLFKDDEITRRVFGNYVSTYDFQRAVEDKATVPLYYDARGDKLGLSVRDLNERIAEKLEELENSPLPLGEGPGVRGRELDVEQRLEQELKRDYHIITVGKRLDQVARDFVRHYSTAWETGKAMLVCIAKITYVRMHKLVEFYWNERIGQLVGAHVRAPFHNMQRLSLDDAFKDEEHPFRVAIVCAIWLTGFDVPCLSTLYLDKPLKAHTLMQAIARANRVNEGKNNGMIVNYCGILKNLRKALATFAGTGDDGRGGEGGEIEPARPDAELLADLHDAVAFVRGFLEERSASLDGIIQQTGFARNAAILAAKEAANENDETRKRFEVMCRAVFSKFKACITIEGVNDCRGDFDAINIVYKSLQQDREQADITDIIRQLHMIVDEAIETQTGPAVAEELAPYDISKINFDRLRREFERSPAKSTTVQNLKTAIEQRLQRLLQQNPLRTDF